MLPESIVNSLLRIAQSDKKLHNDFFKICQRAMDASRIQEPEELTRFQQFRADAKAICCPLMSEKVFGEYCCEAKKMIHFKIHDFGIIKGVASHIVAEAVNAIKTEQPDVLAGSKAYHKLVGQKIPALACAARHSKPLSQSSYIGSAPDPARFPGREAFLAALATWQHALFSQPRVKQWIKNDKDFSEFSKRMAARVKSTKSKAA